MASAFFVSRFRYTVDGGYDLLTWGVTRERLSAVFGLLGSCFFVLSCVFCITVCILLDDSLFLFMYKLISLDCIERF